MEENNSTITETVTQPESKKQKTDKWPVIIGLVVIFLIVGLFTNGFWLFTGKVINPENISLEIGNSPVLGNLSAPVTIYEFSDFSCPFCAAAGGYNEEAIKSLESSNPNWEAPMPKIKENYVKTGKVKVVFKYYPGHGAGVAAQAVGYGLNEQGLFWNFYELAFANQKDTYSISKMRDLASSLNANITQLDEYLASKKYEAQLNKDINEGKAAGVAGTPTFFVNGEKIEGAEAYSEFERVIEEQLAKIK